MISFDRIKERKLFQWAVAYVAGAWLVLQALDLLIERLAWPESIFRIAIAVLGVGFLGALVVAWYHGEKGEQKVSGMEIGMLAGILVIAGAAVAFVGGGTTGGAAAGPLAAGAVPEQGSIAVLPFADMSPEGDQAYFSDGLTEELLNVLAQLPELRVAARTSSFSFKNKDVPVDSIGRALNVAHVLEGSVRKAGNRIRITAQLINAGTGYHLWSETYDRDLEDVFAVQDEISRAIVEQLRVELGAGQVLGAARTASVGAHELYLLGLNRWSHRNRGSLHQAVDYFQQAVDADASYAEAHAGLALAYAVLPQYDYAVPARDAWDKGRAAARRALELDPRSAQAHAALSQIAEYSGDLVTAEREARAAIALNPSYATAHQWLAETLALQGRLQEALAAARRALALDPLSAVVVNIHGAVLQGMGESDAAIREFRRAAELDPEFAEALLNVAKVELTLRRYDAARATIRSTIPAGQDTTLADVMVDGISSPAHRDRLLGLLGSAEGRAMLGYNTTAVLYELAGQRDSALAVAATLTSHPVEATNFRWALLSPELKGLLDDPRLPAGLRPSGAHGQ